MKSFRLFSEEHDNGPHLHIDNPGGEWEKTKQKHADEDISDAKGKRTKGKGLYGSITGHYNHKPVKLEVSKIYKIRGANDEHEFRNHSEQLHHLEKQIGHPSKFDSEEHPIHIQVNHHGEPIALEGNHRLAYAHKHGIKHIYAHLQYVNGGEKADGPLHPDKVKAMHTS